ncbi:MAG: phosphate signaling complex protein PhoU [Anaerolineae bacterium]
MIRQVFDEQITELQEDLLAMANLVDVAVERSIQALAERDKELAQEVIETDEEINSAQRDIEERCLVLIATQQPLAVDLRVIVAISSIATELERMGDYAKGNAQLAIKMADEPLLKPLIDLPRMAQKGRQLLHQQLEAFMDRDAERAKQLSAEDDEIDALYDQVFRELLVFMMSDPRTISRATYLLWTAHNLERIGDRTTNIAERIVFLVTGEVVELNP